MQNCAILRNTLRMLNRQTPSVGNAVQYSENVRNSLVLNYESPALTAELQARFAYVNLDREKDFASSFIGHQIVSVFKDKCADRGLVRLCISRAGYTGRALKPTS
jgi:hypothetical protein